MKVALVVPTYEYVNPGYIYLAPSDFPTGLAYLAGALKRAGHEVIGVNVNNQPPEKPKHEALADCLADMLDNRRPELIGIGGLCADYAFIKDALAILRERAPEIPVVLGGGIVTHDAEFIHGALKPDYSVIGDGEEVLLQLVDHLTTGTPTIEQIPNLGYWHEGAPRFTHENLNYPGVAQRAWPDYEPFEIERMLECSTHGARNHFRYTREFPRIMPFIAARNCPFKCTFCIHSGGAKYTSRPMDDIFAELEDLHRKYQFNILIILDELFSIDKARLREFCEGILERKKTLGWDFDWMFQTHASAALTVDDMRLAREAGCYYFSYGMESASPRVLDSMRKKTHPDQIREAIDFAREARIGFGGNFIFGDLAETPETIIETMAFMTKHCMDMLCYVTNISPYPGSLLFDYCLKEGLIASKLGYYETIDRTVFNMTQMPGDAWQQFLTKLIWPMAGAYPWLISVEPEAVTTEPPDAAFAIPVRRVLARCPHCGTEHPHRQPVNDDVFQEGTVFPTGCPACGLRFRVHVGPNGECHGKVLGRQIDAETLTWLVKEAVQPLEGIKQRTNVLLLVAENRHGDDPLSPALDYLSGAALQEGLTGCGLSVMTVPIRTDIGPGDRGNWLAHLSRLCTGVRFDQIWVQITDIPLDDTLSVFLSVLAPVRVGLIPARMHFGEPIFRIPAALKATQRQVDRRLRSMTHLLVADPDDVRWLESNRKPQVRQWLPALPHSVAHPASGSVDKNGTLSIGDSASEPNDTPQQGLAVYSPTGDVARIPATLADIDEQIATILRSGSAYPPNLAAAHLNALLDLQKIAFSDLAARIASSERCRIGALPVFMQTACILIALASGRTVDIEAAAHHANDPGQLAGVATIEETDHGFRLTPTGNVGQLLAVHALQQRLGEVMRWIEETGGQKLDELRATNNGPVDNLADIVDAAADALRRQDFDAAMLLLGRARQASPQNQDIANLLREIGTQRDAWVRERIEALWEREMAI